MRDRLSEVKILNWFFSTADGGISRIHLCFAQCLPQIFAIAFEITLTPMKEPFKLSGVDG